MSNLQIQTLNFPLVLFYLLRPALVLLLVSHVLRDYEIIRTESASQLQTHKKSQVLYLLIKPRLGASHSFQMSSLVDCRDPDKQ